MRKYFKWIIPFVLFLFVGLMFLVCYYQKQNTIKEYLYITTLAYQNGKNYDDGVVMVPYVYDVKEQKLKCFPALPIEQTVYPLFYYDYRNEKIYHTGAEKGESYDNLYVYDIKKDKDTRITDGKFLFNDFMMVDGKLICNEAPEFVTVTRPAIFNQHDNSFTYLNEGDEDTWCFSLSYHKTENKLLSLTCSDCEMRTYKVRAETFIRPKTIYIMNPDFTEYEPIFFTDDFEIRSTRQLDRNRIMMAADPTMGTGYSPNRKLKIFDISTQVLCDVEPPDLIEINTFYPRDNAEGVFIYAKGHDMKKSIFYYDMVDNTVRDIFEYYEFPPEFCGIVDFTYSCN